MSFKAKKHAKIAGFRSDEGRDRFMQAYDTVLALWPEPPTALDVPTRFGTTRVHRTGAATGTPIVLLHPLGGTSTCWSANVAALGADHPVYAIDVVSDAGRSIQTAPIHDGGEFSVWLDDVLAALDLDRVHLVGVSFGATLAINQAIESPGRLASITPVEPAGVVTSVRTRFLVTMIRGALTHALTKSEKPLLRMMQAMSSGREPAEFGELALRSLTEFRNVQLYPTKAGDETLSRITTPTMVVFGADSPMCEAAEAVARARRLLPDVRAEIVPDAGHAVFLDQPDAFDRLVLDFVDGVDGRHPGVDRMRRNRSVAE